VGVERGRGRGVCRREREGKKEKGSEASLIGMYLEQRAKRELWRGQASRNSAQVAYETAATRSAFPPCNLDYELARCMRRMIQPRPRLTLTLLTTSRLNASRARRSSHRHRRSIFCKGHDMHHGLLALLASNTSWSPAVSMDSACAHTWQSPAQPWPARLCSTAQHSTA
jgi:hypothetical protein